MPVTVLKPAQQWREYRAGEVAAVPEPRRHLERLAPCGIFFGVLFSLLIYAALGFLAWLALWWV